MPVSVDKVSIIIPVLNDKEALQSLLPSLQSLRADGHEILVVDGGSHDGSVTAARSLADRVLMTGTGRGRQMNLGAESARHEVLLFLHADSELPSNGMAAIQEALSNPDCNWGRFDVQFDAASPVYAMIATMMNLRSRITGVATGDQGIFAKRAFFHDMGGYQAIPLMEDIALSKTLRKHSPPICLASQITTSARRWQEHGVFRTIVLMWRLRLAYFCGADPERLVRIYYPEPNDE